MLQLGGGCWITVALASAVILELADIVAMLSRTEECTVELHCTLRPTYFYIGNHYLWQLLPVPNNGSSRFQSGCDRLLYL